MIPDPAVYLDTSLPSQQRASAATTGRATEKVIERILDTGHTPPLSWIASNETRLRALWEETTPVKGVVNHHVNLLVELSETDERFDFITLNVTANRCQRDPGLLDSFSYRQLYDLTAASGMSGCKSLCEYLMTNHIGIPVGKGVGEHLSDLMLKMVDLHKLGASWEAARDAAVHGTAVDADTLAAIETLNAATDGESVTELIDALLS